VVSSFGGGTGFLLVPDLKLAVIFPGDAGASPSLGDPSPSLAMGMGASSITTAVVSVTSAALLLTSVSTASVIVEKYASEQ
jgi:hypothetical protein